MIKSFKSHSNLPKIQQINPLLTRAVKAPNEPNIFFDECSRFEIDRESAVQKQVSSTERKRFENQRMRGEPDRLMMKHWLPIEFKQRLVFKDLYAIAEVVNYFLPNTEADERILKISMAAFFSSGLVCEACLLWIIGFLVVKTSGNMLTWDQANTFVFARILSLGPLILVQLVRHEFSVQNWKIIRVLKNVNRKYFEEAIIIILFIMINS